MLEKFNAKMKSLMDAIRAKSGATGTLTFEQAEDEIRKLTNTSDADATASNIEKGKTAYANGEKVTGTLSYANEYMRGTGSYDISDGFEIQVVTDYPYMVKENQELNFFASSTDFYPYAPDLGITPEKIVEGNTIFGVEGTASITKKQAYIYFESQNPFSMMVHRESGAPVPWNGILEYSLDGGITWVEWNINTWISAAIIGDAAYRICFRGTGNSEITSGTGHGSSGEYGDFEDGIWEIDGTDVRCYGDIRNILNYMNTENVAPRDGCFRSMFAGCNALTRIPDLMLDTVSGSCYDGMFAYCRNLKSLPEFLGVHAVAGSFRSMFAGCTSIKLSEVQTDEYPTPYRIGDVGNATIAPYMFANTGGTFSGTPTAGTYYLHVSNSIQEANDGEYKGPYVVTPKVDESVLLETANRLIENNINIKKIPTYEVSNEADGITFLIGEEGLV